MAQTISLVRYLNSAPLGWGFTHGSLRGKFDLLLSTPAQCAEHLLQGQAEAGLIPVVEYQRIPGLRVVPHISIATQGRSRSVLLVSRVPGDEIRSLALDADSRTSSILVQLMIEEVFNARPKILDLQGDLKNRLRDVDAALVIGDPALEISPEEPWVYDLGELWVRRTGLPFVFAFWTIRGSEGAEVMAQAFEESKRYGLQHLSEIGQEFSARLRLPEQLLLDYLLMNLDFDLGPRHVRGLELFYQKAESRGLLQDCRPLEFFHA